jgi:hypothetical protein
VSFRVKGSREPWGVEGPRRKQVKHAIPVYSVDTIAEAEFIQVTLCVLRYDGSFALTPSELGPGAWTGRNLELEDLDRVTDIMRTVHENHWEGA